MDWLAKYADIPEVERIRRIGALLATAAERHLASRRDQPSGAECERDSGTVPPSPPPGDETERRMIGFIARVEVATPKDFRVALGLSAMTVTRRLAGLRSQGLLAVEGKTRSVRYRLNARMGAK